MPIEQLTKESALHVAGKFIELAAELKDEGAQQRLEPRLQQLRLGLFRLVVVGEIKKGKSSFINALLGEPRLLPVTSNVATSTVFKIMYGETKQYKVFFYPKEASEPDARPAPREVSEEQIADYGTEDGNPNNEKGVDFIGVQLPHPLLKSGVVIIDTPGLGGLIEEHREITWRYVPSADAIFFVLDSVEAVASQDEITYLEKLCEMSSLLFFVQTKIDLVSAEQWQSWRNRNLEILSQQLQVPQEKLIYFPVSAALKINADQTHSARSLDESGFVPLLHFLHEKLLKAKEEKLARMLLEALAVETANIRRRLGEQLQVLDTTSKEGLDALEREYAETKAAFDKWRATEYQQAVRAFQDQSNDLKRETLDGLQNQLDPSPSGPIIGPIIAQLREHGFDLDELNTGVGAIQSFCVENCTKIIFELQGHYSQSMKQLIAETSQRLGKSYAAETTALIKGVSLPGVASLNLHHSGFEEARTALFGGTAGSMMASLVTGIFFPPAGAAMAVATVIGTIVGTLAAFRDLRKRREGEAINKLQGILIDTVRLSQRQATQQFQATAAEMERTARHAFENAAAETLKEIEGKMRLIAESRKNVRQENERQASALKQVISRVDSLLSTIGTLAGAEQQSSVLPNVTKPVAGFSS